MARAQPSKRPQQPPLPPLRPVQTLHLVHRKPALPLCRPPCSTLGASLHLHLDRRRLQLHRLLNQQLLLLYHLLVSRQHLHHPLGSQQQQQLHQHLVSQLQCLHRLLANQQQQPHHLLGSQPQRHQHSHLGSQDHLRALAPSVSQDQQPHQAPLATLPPQHQPLVGSPLQGLLLGNLALQVIHLSSLPFSCCSSTSLKGGSLLPCQISWLGCVAKNIFWVFCYVQLILSALLRVKCRLNGVQKAPGSFASSAYAVAGSKSKRSWLFTLQAAAAAVFPLVVRLLQQAQRLLLELPTVSMTTVLHQCYCHSTAVQHIIPVLVAVLTLMSTAACFVHFNGYNTARI